MTKHKKREVRVHVRGMSETNKVVLVADQRGITRVHGGSAHEFGALAFVEQDVARNETINFLFSRSEIHLAQISGIEEILENVGHTEIREHVFAILVLRGTLAPHSNLARLIDTNPAPSGRECAAHEI